MEGPVHVLQPGFTVPSRFPAPVYCSLNESLRAHFLSYILILFNYTSWGDVILFYVYGCCTHVKQVVDRTGKNLLCEAFSDWDQALTVLPSYLENTLLQQCFICFGLNYLKLTEKKIVGEKKILIFVGSNAFVYFRLYCLQNFLRFLLRWRSQIFEGHYI